MRCRGRRVTCFAADDISPAQTTAYELLHKPVMRYCYCVLHIAGARSLPEDYKPAYCAKRHMDMQMCALDGRLSQPTGRLCLRSVLSAKHRQTVKCWFYQGNVPAYHCAPGPASRKDVS